MFAEIIVEGRSTIPSLCEIFSPGVALSRGCERTPYVRAEHRTRNELVGISTRQKTLRTRVGPRVLQGRIAFKPGKVREPVKQITHDLHAAMIGGIGAIGSPMAVVRAVAFEAYSRGRIPFDPVQVPFFDNVSQLLLDPRHHFGIAEAQLLGGSKRRMCDTKCLAVDHRQPVRRNLTRFHSRCVNVPRVHPNAEFQAHSMHGVRKSLEAMRKFLLTLLIAAEPDRKST